MCIEGDIIVVDYIVSPHSDVSHSMNLGSYHRSPIWAIPHWRAYIAKKLILFQQDKNVSTYVQHM